MSWKAISKDENRNSTPPDARDSRTTAIPAASPEMAPEERLFWMNKRGLPWLGWVLRPGWR
jgi:hypothetical protein